MTDADWGLLSDQAVAAAGVVYFLALLAHIAEWASMRTPGCGGERGRGSTAAASSSRPVAEPSPTRGSGWRSSAGSA